MVQDMTECRDSDCPYHRKFSSTVGECMLGEESRSYCCPHLTAKPLKDDELLFIEFREEKVVLDTVIRHIEWDGDTDGWMTNLALETPYKEIPSELHGFDRNPVRITIEKREVG